MTISNFRATEALYLVIVRDRDAERQLREWARKNNSQVGIENNRMKIYETHSFNTFLLTWTGDWNQTAIWDYWNKRHLYFDQ
jgi:hypothetical protein